METYWYLERSWVFIGKKHVPNRIKLLWEIATSAHSAAFSDAEFLRSTIHQAVLYEICAVDSALQKEAAGACLQQGQNLKHSLPMCRAQSLRTCRPVCCPLHPGWYGSLTLKLLWVRHPGRRWPTGKLLRHWALVSQLLAGHPGHALSLQLQISAHRQLLVIH